MILVAIGANLPAADGTSALDTCRSMAQRLAGLTGLRLVAVSRWYRSAPVPASGQPDYVNGMAALEGVIEPAALLACLQRAERGAGRVRGAANAARELDLDIIDMDRLLRDAPDPVLPHPRAHLRGFVLWPLRDVAPGWTDPRSGMSVDALLAALPLQKISLIAP
jgi:2-amino-4-hydroxy-6-hydroxymethyldihydropteridine diphosphokinase